MPYKSDAQRKFFNANKKKLEKQGINVALTEIEEEEDIGMNKCVICNKELQAIEINNVPYVGDLCDVHIERYKEFIKRKLRDFCSSEKVQEGIGNESKSY